MENIPELSFAVSVLKEEYDYLEEVIVIEEQFFAPYDFHEQYIQALTLKGVELDPEEYSSVIDETTKYPILQYTEAYDELKELLVDRGRHFKSVGLHDNRVDLMDSILKHLHSVFQLDYTYNEYNLLYAYEKTLGRQDRIDILNEVYTPIFARLQGE